MKNDVHIGNIISEYLRATGRSKKWLAERVSRSESAFCRVLKHDYIDTALLMDISRVLNYDFFRHFSNVLNVQAGVEEKDWQKMQ
jgi:hypothetical protein